MFEKKNISAGIELMQATCTTGATCTAVTTSPTGGPALSAFNGQVGKVILALTAYNNARNVFITAGQNLRKEYQKARVSCGTYMTCVDEIANGDGTIVAAAGCTGRVENPSSPALDKVTNLRGKPWKTSASAHVQWGRVPGAANYMVEVNANPQNPTGTFVSAGNASPRVTKVLNAPAPGAQLLVRVAALHPDGTQSEWCDPILVTSRL